MENKTFTRRFIAPIALFVAIAVAIAQILVVAVPKLATVQYYIACIAVALMGIGYCVYEKEFDIDIIISTILALIAAIPINWGISAGINFLK